MPSAAVASSVVDAAVATPNAAHTAVDDLAASWSRRARCRRCRRRPARRLMPRSRAARQRSRRPGPGTRTVIVSKKCRRRPRAPPARSPAARIAREPVHPLGDARAGPSGPWYDRVQAGDDGEQHLRGADVARRLLAADVLLAGLQREAERGAARRRRPTRRRAGRAACARSASRVARNAAWGPPKPSGTPKRCAEPTTTSAPISPGGVSSTRASRSAATATSAPAAWTRSRDTARPSRTAPDEPGYWSSTPKQPVGSHVGRRRRRRRPRCRAARRGCARRRSSAGGSRRRRRTSSLGPSTQPAAHRHRLGRRGRLVEQRRVGEVHAGEVGDHRLEVQERLEPALGDLGLVRRVGRVPGRVLEHVAQDDRRRDRAGVAQADERGRHLVAGGELPELGEHLGLGAARRERRAARRRGSTRHRGVDQRVERLDPERGEHRACSVRGRADVAVGELAVVLAARPRWVDVGNVGSSSGDRSGWFPLCRGT